MSMSSFVAKIGAPLAAVCIVVGLSAMGSAASSADDGSGSTPPPTTTTPASPNGHPWHN